MAVQGVITLNSKAYNPRGKTGDVASWQFTGDASFGGARSTVTTTIRGPSRDGMYRGRIKIDVPKNAETDSACGCAGTQVSLGLVDAQFAIPANFTAAERTDFKTRAQALFAHAVTTALLESLEGSW